MATFGVTASDIAGMCFGLSFGASSTPTATQVAALITEHGAVASSHLYDKRVDPDGLTSSDPAYQFARGMVRYRVAAETLIAAQHRLDMVDRYTDLADAREKKLMAHPGAALGASQSTSADAPNRMQWTGDYDSEIADNLTSANLGRRMARNREI